MVVPRSLPRGKHALDRDVVLVSQRARILEGIVHAVAEKGYAATTVGDVTRYAGVSRTTFYEQFRDKQDCFLAAYEAGARAHFDQVARASAGVDGWLEQLRAGTRVYLRVLAESPAHAQALLVEVMAAGPDARRLVIAAQHRYVEALRTWHSTARTQVPGVPALPEAVFHASVAATNELVIATLRGGDPTRLPGLEPMVLYVELALFGFREEARDALGAAAAASDVSREDTRWL